MTFKTHYEPVPVSEKPQESDELVICIWPDGRAHQYKQSLIKKFYYQPTTILRPRPDTVLLTREEVGG